MHVDLEQHKDRKELMTGFFIFLAELFLSQFFIACSPLCSEMAL